MRAPAAGGRPLAQLGDLMALGADLGLLLLRLFALLLDPLPLLLDLLLLLLDARFLELDDGRQPRHLLTQLCYIALVPRWSPTCHGSRSSPISVAALRRRSPPYNYGHVCAIRPVAVAPV
jgi:hypothetical protein